MIFVVAMACIVGRGWYLGRIVCDAADWVMYSFDSRIHKSGCVLFMPVFCGYGQTCEYLSNKHR
jgi:hypothetical protein